MAQPSQRCLHGHRHAGGRVMLWSMAKSPAHQHASSSPEGLLYDPLLTGFHIGPSTVSRQERLYTQKRRGGASRRDTTSGARTRLSREQGAPRCARGARETRLRVRTIGTNAVASESQERSQQQQRIPSWQLGNSVQEPAATHHRAPALPVAARRRNLGHRPRAKREGPPALALFTRLLNLLQDGRDHVLRSIVRY